MAEYTFLSTWCLRDVTLADAFETLRNSIEYPRWWRDVRSVEVVRRADPREATVGDIIDLRWRSRLPYTLRFALELTRIEAPYVIEATARGDLEGRGAWRLYEGPGVAVVFDWRVRTTKQWMNAFHPLARPVFVWNHDLVMRAGARGLARHLDGAVVACD